MSPAEGFSEPRCEHFLATAQHLTVYKDFPSKPCIYSMKQLVHFADEETEVQALPGITQGRSGRTEIRTLGFLPHVCGLHLAEVSSVHVCIGTHM